MLYVIANFGGPRSLRELREFLTELLTDQDVIRTNLPPFLHKILFTLIARRRVRTVKEEYEAIGGKSPLYEDTEYLAEVLREHLDGEVITFHRYLPKTHKEALRKLEESEESEIRIFPLFPQFAYATTGSIAHLFERRLSNACIAKMRWVSSYATHPAFVNVWKKLVTRFLDKKQLHADDVFFLFSFHGVPQAFIDNGADLYEEQCVASQTALMQFFPGASHMTAYQSRLGKAKWLEPYTEDVCQSISSYAQDKKHVLIIPMSFTSDHYETLFEIEDLYLPEIQKQGYKAHRLEAPNRDPEWLKAIVTILEDSPLTNNQMLIWRACVG